MVVEWTTPAVQDLKDFRKITKMSNSSKYIFNLVNYVSLLSEQPHLGKIYFYTHNHIIRQLIYKQHRIFYYIDKNTIYILTVVHHRQNIQYKIKYIKNRFN